MKDIVTSLIVRKSSVRLFFTKAPSWILLRFPARCGMKQTDPKTGHTVTRMHRILKKLESWCAAEAAAKAAGKTIEAKVAAVVIDYLDAVSNVSERSGSELLYAIVEDACREARRSGARGTPRQLGALKAVAELQELIPVPVDTRRFASEPADYEEHNNSWGASTLRGLAIQLFGVDPPPSARLSYLVNVRQRQVQYWLAGRDMPPPNVRETVEKQVAAVEEFDLKRRVQDLAREAAAAGVDPTVIQHYFSMNIEMLIE